MAWRSLIDKVSSWSERFRSQNVAEYATFVHDGIARGIHVTSSSVSTIQAVVEGFRLYADSAIFVAFAREFTDTSGQFHPPRVGDRLIKTWPTGCIAYNVVSAGSSPCWWWPDDDPARRVFMFHTQRER